MTNEEAVRILETVKHEYDKFDKDHETHGFETFIEALDVALGAIQKPISRKPTLEGDGYWNGELVMDTWICPGCGNKHDLEGDWDKLNYCPECGQKIDWTNDDEVQEKENEDRVFEEE